MLKYVDFDFVLGADGVKILQPKSFLHSKFFYYQMQSFEFESLGYSRHYRLLKAKSIAYPSYVEQERIVAILDGAFEGIATAKATCRKNIQNVRCLFKDLLTRTFSQQGRNWPMRPVSEIASQSLGKMLDKVKNRGIRKTPSSNPSSIKPFP